MKLNIIILLLFILSTTTIYHDFFTKQNEIENKNVVANNNVKSILSPYIKKEKQIPLSVIAKLPKDYLLTHLSKIQEYNKNIALLDLKKKVITNDQKTMK